MDLTLVDPNIMKTSVHHIVYIGEVLDYFHWPTDSPSPKVYVGPKIFLESPEKSNGEDR